MRAGSSNPYALHPPPVLSSTGVEYAGWRAPHASQILAEGWRVTPATKLCSGFLTVRERLFLCLAQLRNDWSVYDRDRRWRIYLGECAWGYIMAPRYKRGQ